MGNTRGTERSHVPVPYSWNVKSPHFEHCGAWPADLCYGEIHGVWTDSVVNNTSAIRPENHNVPGDGEFGQTWLPSDVDLEVGRVDLSRMPEFGVDEYELMRRYLDKNHADHQGEFTPGRRGLIDDNVGDGRGTAPAALGWRNLTALFRQGNVHATDYLTTLEGASYLWSYGCGAGGYSRCNGIGTTADFAAMSPQTVFTALFGRYFGDWDNEDNILVSSNKEVLILGNEHLVVIEALAKRGVCLCDIARELDVHPKTVRRTRFQPLSSTYH